MEEGLHEKCYPCARAYNVNGWEINNKEKNGAT